MLFHVEYIIEHKNASNYQLVLSFIRINFLRNILDEK